MKKFSRKKYVLLVEGRLRSRVLRASYICKYHSATLNGNLPMLKIEHPPPFYYICMYIHNIQYTYTICVNRQH